MKQSDYERFHAMLREAAEYFRDTQPLTDSRIAIYWQTLELFDFDRIVKAMTALYNSRKYDGLPKAADLREAMTPEWKEPPKAEPLTWADLEGFSAKARFTRYLIVTGKWKEIGSDPEGRVWRGKYEEWKTAGQPMPTPVQMKKSLFGGLR